MFKKIGYLIAGLIIIYAGYTLSLTRPEYATKKQRFDQILTANFISSDLEKEAQTIINDIQKSTTYAANALSMQTTLDKAMSAQTVSQTDKTVSILERELNAAAKLNGELTKKIETLTKKCTEDITQASEDKNKELEQLTSELQNQQKNYNILLNAVGTKDLSTALQKMKDMASQSDAAQRNVELKQKYEQLKNALKHALGEQLANSLQENVAKSPQELQQLITYQDIEKSTPIAQALKYALDQSEEHTQQMDDQRTVLVQVLGQQNVQNIESIRNPNAPEIKTVLDANALPQDSQAYQAIASCERIATSEPTLPVTLQILGPKNFSRIMKLANVESEIERYRDQGIVINPSSVTDNVSPENALQLQDLPQGSQAFKQFAQCTLQSSQIEDTQKTLETILGEENTRKVQEAVGYKTGVKLATGIAKPVALSTFTHKANIALSLENLPDDTAAKKEYAQLKEQAKRGK